MYLYKHERSHAWSKLEFYYDLYTRTYNLHGDKMERIQIKKPGLFSKQVAADNRRAEFDCKNEVLLTNNVKVDFVFIGDSITQMWELNAYFNKPGKVIVNRGIGSDTSEYLLKRFEADVLQLQPENCILMIGVNDSFALEDNGWGGEKGESIDEVAKRTIKNLTEIVMLSIKNKQKLILCSILPTNITFTFKCNERNEFIVKVNSAMKKVCEDNGVLFVDYHSHLVDTDGLTIKDGLTIEGLHPHVYGYNIMAEVLTTTLQQHGIEI